MGIYVLSVTGTIQYTHGERIGLTTEKEFGLPVNSTSVPHSFMNMGHGFVSRNVTCERREVEREIEIERDRETGRWKAGREPEQM